MSYFGLPTSEPLTKALHRHLISHERDCHSADPTPPAPSLVYLICLTSRPLKCLNYRTYRESRQRVYLRWNAKQSRRNQTGLANREMKSQQRLSSVPQNLGMSSLAGNLRQSRVVDQTAGTVRHFLVLISSCVMPLNHLSLSLNSPYSSIIDC